MIRRTPLSAIARAVVIAGALSALGACASGARPTQMAVSTASLKPIAPGVPGYKELRVAHVGGGGGTNPLWMSNVSSNDFLNALEASLKASNYLADDPEKAKTEITAELVDLKRPLAGLDMSVTTRVRYSGKALPAGNQAFDETVAATGTAKLGDAFIGTERLRLANEAAIRANIEAFLQRLAELLPGRAAVASN
jgi:hypothetical protein